MQQQKFGMNAKKDEDFHSWYTQVITKAELIDYYDVKGFYIMRPNSMFIWSELRKYFEDHIQKMGVQECYFPMLVSKENIEQEKAHLENFNPELVWITKCGEEDIKEPLAIRPTSETIIYPAFAKWLSSYRDLPMKINQWCSVIRWEVKSTLPFIRGREFLWQEGHTAYYNKPDAEKETLEILNLYAKVYKELLAVPVVKGIKTKKETFGGAEYTASVEAFIPGTGKGVQGATSHHLGQNFAKMFDIKVDSNDKQKDKELVYQNCWGLTTRSIGVAVMVHSDDNGFVCPPRVAQIQVVIIPCGIKASTTDDEKAKLKAYVEEIASDLKSNGIRVHIEDRDDLSPGYKFNHWELRGVPCRVEVGFKDLAKGEICVVRRDTRGKEQISKSEASAGVKRIMDKMHEDLYNKALAERDARTKVCDDFESMYSAVNDKNLTLVPWCGDVACENSIGEKTTVRDGDSVVLMGAKSLCIPFDTPSFEGKKCVICKNSAKCYALFGRSY